MLAVYYSDSELYCLFSVYLSTKVEMKFLGYLVIFVGIASILGENCDHLGVLLYEDLGCTPEYGEPKSCPIKYSCTGLEQSNDKCYFRGKGYADGERPEDALTAPSCNMACFCSKYGGKPKFSCAILDCPEWLGVSTKPGCYRTHSLDECCSVGSKCPPFNNIQKCTVDGTEYKEGESFYPENSCQHCICQKGFNKKYEEPFCKRITCGVQLGRRSAEDLENSCAPLYGKKSEKTLCCPSNWICPDGSENITGVVKNDNVCKFGDKTLKVGQGFEKTNIETSFGRKVDKITCECILPPLLTCNEV